MHSSALLFALALCLALPACTDDPSAAADGGGLAPPTLVGIGIEACEPIEADPFPSPACADMPRPVVDYEFEPRPDGIHPAIVGRWTLCSGNLPFSVFNPSVLQNPGAVGLEFGADGTWTVVRMGEDGPFLSRERGESGRFTVEPYFLIMRDSDGQGVYGSVWLLGCGPHQLVLDGGLFARGPSTGRRDRLPSIEPKAARCNTVGTPVELPAAVDAAGQALSGLWQACPGSFDLGPLFIVPSAHDFGIQLMPSGDWWRLQLQEGQVVRSGHVGGVGSWSLEADGPNTGGWWLNVFLVGGVGAPGGTVVLTENPRQLHWYNYSIETPMVFVSLDP